MPVTIATNLATSERRAEAEQERHRQHAGEDAEENPERHQHKRVEREQAEAPMRLDDARDHAVEQRRHVTAVHVDDLPPGRAREVLADDVFPAQELVARRDLPALAAGGRVPGRDEAVGIVFSAADLSAQSVKFAGAAVLAAEHAVIFRQPARVVTLHVDDESAFDGHAQSTSSGSLPVGLPSASSVIFSTRASA